MRMPAAGIRDVVVGYWAQGMVPVAAVGILVAGAVYKRRARRFTLAQVANLQLVQAPAADALLESNPFALVVGMLLDQQVPMETAFAGPKKIADRIGDVDARLIAGYDPDRFAALC